MSEAGYSMFEAYSKSKLAQLLATRGLQRRDGDQMVMVFDGIEGEVEISRRLVSEVRRALKALGRRG